ncbi:MAG: InlB B-repeat-containing protein, partial [Paludibacteraceae bacterium]|nr:InlB B-repeat-containing protein [Paludibacteraceae bacterium]
RTAIYNGSAQDTTGYEWRASSALYQAADFSYEGDSLAKGTEIGTYAMNLKKENFTNNNDNYTVTFEVEDGWLKINPLAVTVTITGHTRTTIYNGSAQDTTGYEWRASSTLYQAADFSYEGDSLAKGTEIGTYAMNLTAENFTNKNDNYTVTFEVEDGWLKINPLAVTVTITGHTRTTIYNGSAQDTTGYEWSANTKLYQASDFGYAGDSLAEGIDVGTYYMSLKEEHFSNINKNFEVTFSLLSDGKLEITPLDLSVDIIGHTKVVAYNGVAQKVTGYEWEASTALYQKADFSYAGDSLATGVTLGTYPMELSPAQFSNQNPNFGEVAFRVVSDGYIQITPITTPITITANSSKTVYDGSPFSNDGFKYTRNVLVAGDVLKAVVEGTIKNVGETANVVTSYRVVRIDAATKEEVDVTENYTFTDPEDGKLTVTKRAVLLRSASDTKVYDGKALTNAQVEVVGDLSVGGFVFGEGAAYDVTGSITEVGSADNLFTYRLRSNTLAENYDIRVEYGTLTVTLVESAIVITANSQSKLYDGEPLSDPGFTFTPNVLAKGDVIEATVVGEVTAVGSVANRVESFKVVRGDLDVTKNYTFGESKEGILTVTPRQVILTSATDSKPYDRQPLVNGHVEVGGDGFAKGEGATFQVTGSLTEEGSVENSFTYVLTDNTVSTNYLIQSVTGLLTVTPRPTAIVLDYGYAVKADTLGGFADKDFEFPADPLRKGYAFESWEPALPALLPLDTLRSVAQWRLLEYKVALDTFGQISYTVEDHATIDLADYTPSRIGYDFTGWVDEKGYGVEHVNTSEARSIALKATWRMANYAIHYLSAGKEWKQVPMTYGETIASVPQPVRNGYLFKGWTPALPATMPNKDLTVEADWEIIHYSLMLVDEGRDAGTLSYTVEDDDFYLDKLADRPGQEFSGWTMAGELLDYDEVSGQYIFHPSEVASDVLLEAAWTIVSNEFTIDFYVDGAKYKTLRLMAGANTASYIATVRDPRDKAGYRFGGWDLDLPEEMPRKNLEVSAVWKPISYKLILLNEQGVETYLTNYTIEDEVLLPNFEDPEGKREFLGWTDGKNYYKTFDPSKFLKDVELVEAWKLRSFQVIYFVSGKEYARDTFHVGDSIAKIPDPEDYIEGYAFSGWSETPTYMPTEDVKVNSYYELGGYTLTYKSEGRVVKSVRYLYQAPISPSRGISKYGYEFKYWAGVPSNMPGRDIEVEAVYDVATYRLVLRDGTEVIDSLHYTIYDEDIKLPVLDERGRVFRGWYDGTKTITTVKKGSYASNMDLVANWTYINYTLIFMVDGVEYKKKNTMRCGDEITLPKEPVKEGAEFIRWEGMPTDGLMPDDDLILTAVFSTQVGETLVTQSPTVALYSADWAIHILRAEGKSVTVMDLNGLILFEGKSGVEDYVVPVRRHGAYLVRVDQEVKKILVK